MDDNERAMAVCQMHCAILAYSGAGVNLDEFIRGCDLDSQECLDLAKEEEISEFIIEAIREAIKKKKR